MIVREFTILNKSGLHARPAAAFVKTASEFKSEISVYKDEAIVPFVRHGKPEVSVDGKSIMGLLVLAAAHGSKIIVEVSGPDESQMILAIQKIIEDKFNES